MIIGLGLALLAAGAVLFFWLSSQSSFGGPWGLLGVWREAALVIWDGLAGGGKTYMMSIVVSEWLANGHPVITNLKMASLPFDPLASWGEYLLAEDSDFLPARIGDAIGLPVLDKVSDLQERHPDKHILLAVDECHDFFPEGDASKKPVQFCAWIAKHRHMNVSVLLLSQHCSLIHAGVRKRAQEFRRHENILKNPKFAAWAWIFGRGQHVAYSMPNKGGLPNPNPELRTEIQRFRIRKNTARHYNSSQYAKGDGNRFIINGADGAIRRAILIGILLIVGFRLAGAGVVLVKDKFFKPSLPGLVKTGVSVGPKTKTVKAVKTEKPVVFSGQLEAVEALDGYAVLGFKVGKSVVEVHVPGSGLEWLDRVGTQVEITTQTIGLHSGRVRVL